MYKKLLKRANKVGLMRILNINYEYPPVGGGGGIGNARIVSELSKRHRIDVITSHFDGLARFSQEGNVEIHRVTVLARREKATASLASLVTFPPSAIIRCLGSLRSNQYDLVHSYFAIPSGVAGLLIAKALGIPHVLTIIGGDIYDPTKPLSPHHHRIFRSVVSTVLDHSDRIVAISQDVKQRAQDYYAVRKPIEVINLGLLATSLATSADNGPKTKAAESDNEFVMVTVGRLVKRKGIDTFLHALSLLPNPNYRAIIIGEGPERAMLQLLAHKLGLDDKVEFTGFISEDRKCRYLSEASAFVLPSVHEGLGLVYLEAMQWGLPVIAGNVGGQNDFLTDGETGFLVAPGNPQELANKITLLMQDPQCVQIMGKRNREIADSFSASKIASCYEKLYQDTLRDAS